MAGVFAEFFVAGNLGFLSIGTFFLVILLFVFFGLIGELWADDVGMTVFVTLAIQRFDDH